MDFPATRALYCCAPTSTQIGRQLQAGTRRNPAMAKTYQLGKQTYTQGLKAGNQVQQANLFQDMTYGCDLSTSTACTVVMATVSESPQQWLAFTWRP